MNLQYRNPKHWRSPRNLTLNQAFPDWSTGGGIITQLSQNTTLPWEGVSQLGLDISYHGQRSGSKFVAPIIYNWLSDTGAITPQGITALSSAIAARYYQKWFHIWQVYTADYSPLDSYNITETNEESHSDSKSGSNTRTPNLTTRDVLDQDDTDSHTTTNDTTYGEKVENAGSTTYGHAIANTSSNTSTQLNQVFGFNSSEPTDQSKSTTTGSGTSNETNSGKDESSLTETHSGTDKLETKIDGTNTRDATNTRTETGTDSTNRSESSSGTSSYTTTRKGNLYRSPAELLSLDREFWLEDYFSIVFADLDEFLTLAVYSDSDPKVAVF